MYNPQIEKMSHDELRQIQSNRLNQMLTRQYEHVPFYRNKFTNQGIHPSDIKSIEDISSLPFTRKSDLRDNYPFDLLATPMEEVRRIHASSGTTGQPTVVAYTQNDLDMFDEVVARSLYCAGARPGMKLHNAYGYGLFTGGLGVHSGATKLGMAVIPVSGGMTERQVRLIQDFKPDVISCTPSYAQRLTDEFSKRGISPESLSLQYAVLGAEPWTEAIRVQVENGLGLKASNIYGLSEIIGPGVSREDVEEKGTGSYIWEDHFYPEVVDKDTGEVLPYGEEGVLVFTTLTKEALPLLRYWTNDICSINYDPNGKRTHIKMSSIKGRADDMLIIRGVNLFHTQVEEVINEMDFVEPHYQLIVTRNGNMDNIEVAVEVAQGVDDASRSLADTLKHHIKESIGLSMKISLKPIGSMGRSEGGKLSRVLDKREQMVLGEDA
ncbi:MAG: AMP-binding protein [Saprospiraceae bacterium]|nr:AMP-binding protein [Bacteroidia bacterium]NNK90377.1 AMP-binding protein [Saprospiraceae bacterium]